MIIWLRFDMEHMPRKKYIIAWHAKLQKTLRVMILDDSRIIHGPTGVSWLPGEPHPFTHWTEENSPPCNAEMNYKTLVAN